jgi:sugar phosphate isomerase/epimerase
MYPSPMTRREMLTTTGAGLTWLSTRGLSSVGADTPPMLKNMGGEGPGFANRSRAGGFDLLEHCHGLGFGAVRLNLPQGGPDAVRALREKLDAYGMRCIIGATPPHADAAVAEYDAAIAAARELGAVTTHASFTQRRYEEFDSVAAFKTSFEAHKKSVERAEPILRKYKMKLAIENHKGWRAAEHATWVKQVGSEYVGVCYDFGNNIALCEDPVETYRLLAPLTIYVSFKDMAVAPYEEGFLLSEMALGEGMLDIPGMVKGLQQRDPNMIFALEMITRAPLKIPVFTRKYWATFDDSDSPLPGRDLARIMEIVRTTKLKQPLTTTEGLSPAEALTLEDSLIDRSIAYARRNLSL